MTPNQRAFLDMIAVSEGTYDKGDRGYNVLFGGKLFTSYADHPRQYVRIPPSEIVSSAAGRYQILARIYDSYKALLNLPDFSPNSQDRIAIKIIDECGAASDIETGHLDSAISKCAHIWASFPGAGYNQPENSFHLLYTAFTDAGGSIAVIH